MLLLAGLRWVIVPHVKLEFSHFVYYGLKASIFVKIGFLRITGRSVHISILKKIFEGETILYF